jgi:hypothetical protein
MAIAYIYGGQIVGRDLGDGKISKNACLKVFRDKDKTELSIAFDNSCGAFGDKLSRIEVCIFGDKNSFSPLRTIYPAGSLELSKIISSFVSGRKY